MFIRVGLVAFAIRHSRRCHRIELFVAPRICRAAAPSEMEMIGPIGRADSAGFKGFASETPPNTLVDEAV